MSPGTLGAGRSCSIKVRFRPSALGSRTAKLTVTHSGSNSPQSITLSGVGTAPVTISPTSLTFAGQVVSRTSAVKTVQVTNHLSSDLHFSSISASGDFAVASNNCGTTLGAGAQCSSGIKFTPTASGVRQGALSISDSAYGSPSLVPLRGTGVEAGLAWGKIQHVVVIFQENRTPDNLFHDPVLIAKGADIASSGINSSGDTIPLTPTPLGVDYDLQHGHADFVAMYDNGKMDGADKILVQCFNNPDCPTPNPHFKYVRASDVGPYFQLAEQYTFGDRMFQTNQGPSFPAHQFILSGTSAPTATSNLFASSNTSIGTGCAAPDGARVALIDSDGESGGSTYPCFEHPTLTDELDNKGVSWRFYTPSTGSLWTAPNAIQHMCQAQTKNGQLACTGTAWNNVIINPTQVLVDIANNQLPAVAWVMPSGRNSDHAEYLENIGGPSWVASIVNAIGASSYWPNTAIIIA